MGRLPGGGAKALNSPVRTSLFLFSSDQTQREGGLIHMEEMEMLGLRSLRWDVDEPRVWLGCNRALAGV